MFALFAAAECGDAKKVDQLLTGDVEDDRLIHETDYRNRTALHLAVEHGHYEVVETLIAHGADLRANKDRAGFTALHLAAELGHDKIVARLLEEDPKLIDDLTGGHNLTCLHLAAIRGHAAVVRQLLATDHRDLLINAEDKRDCSALFFAVKYDHPDIVVMLVESVKSSPDQSKAMFRAALRYGFDNIASQILVQNPSFVEAVKSGMKILHLTAAAGCHTIVSQVLAANSHLAEVGRREGKSVLHILTERGYDTIVGQLLVEKPHLSETLDDNSRNALHIAARAGDENIVAQLVAVNPALALQKDREGQTPLHKAAQGGFEKVVAELLAHGRPEAVDAVDLDGLTALHSALPWRADLEKSGKVVTLLLAHKPELARCVDRNGNTPLHCLFDRQIACDDFMRTLWQANPEALHQTNKYQKTPFDLAVRNGNEVVVELMQSEMCFDELFKHPQLIPRPLLDQMWGSLLESLNKDVVGTVWEYLGLEFKNNKPVVVGMRYDDDNSDNNDNHDNNDNSSDNHDNDDDDDNNDEGDYNEGDGNNGGDDDNDNEGDEDDWRSLKGTHLLVEGDEGGE